MVRRIITAAYLLMLVVSVCEFKHIVITIIIVYHCYYCLSLLLLFITVLNCIECDLL